MKRILSVTMFGACLLTVSPVSRAQDCSSMTNWDLRGTYTMSGSGYVDPSKLFPGLGLAPGPVPMFWVGAHTWDGTGGGTGWVTINSGGNQMTAQIVATKYSINTNPDLPCAIHASFSMQIKALGITVGPFQRILVPSGKPDSLELHMIFEGTPLGAAPVAGFDIGVERRISMQY